MKKEYDFSDAEQGQFYRPLHELDIPLRLDKDVKKIILKTARKEHPPELPGLMGLNDELLNLKQPV